MANNIPQTDDLQVRQICALAQRFISAEVLKYLVGKRNVIFIQTTTIKELLIPQNSAKCERI